MKQLSRRQFLALIASGTVDAILLSSLNTAKASSNAEHLLILPHLANNFSSKPKGEILGTVRVGQLTGSTDPTTWRLLVDPQKWPLLNDTSRWGVAGVDLGANTEHCDGRLYFFFGDAATTLDSGNRLNSDLVAWIEQTQVLRLGGHLALGLKFVLPFEPTGVQGQSDWRFCGKCGGLFWDGDPNFKGSCPKGSTHEAIGLRFVLPFEPTGVQGQSDWRFCGKCGGLFWDGDPNFKGSCPKGSTHEAIGLKFVLPFEPAGVQGQSDWRFCGKCGGLFWDGDSNKGICSGSEGGGFHLHAVLKENGGKFYPFEAESPIGKTFSDETPNGAFSYGGRVYVFAGISEPKYTDNPPRSGDPSPGCYLVSTDRPDLPEIYHKEFLFSPRIGWCPRDQSRDRLESHDLLGFKFVLPHDIIQDSNHQGNWRFCGKCEALFWDGDPNFKGICPRDNLGHQAIGLNFVLPHSIPEDTQNQANWRRCSKCAAIFFDGDPDPTKNGLCPGGGYHQTVGVNITLSHLSILEDFHHQAGWHFCGKCSGLFWNGNPDKGQCPKDGLGHEAIGYDFVLQHNVAGDTQNQIEWRLCEKCGGLFWNGDQSFKGLCPKGGSHQTQMGSFNFALLHDVSEDIENQANWRFCGKCGGLFYDGYPSFKGVCPKDGAGHEAIGFNFVLPHNPGEETWSQGGWRFCTKCHGLVWSRQPDYFSWVAPVVVQNANHPGLPQSPYEQGLVMFGFHYSDTPGIRLAWMPLKTPATPMLQDIQYYTGDASQSWSSNANAAAVILTHTNTYTHLSAAWLEGSKRWILLYSNAYDEPNKPTDPSHALPIVARIGTSLWNWSDEIKIFDPITENAYGKSGYMHEIGHDTFYPDIPPINPNDEHNGWAYGAFLLNRFTEWNATTRELGIYYLLSLSYPYQVQLMYTRVHLGVDDKQLFLPLLRR